MFNKKYFQDRLVLFLNLVLVLGVLINILSIVLRVNTGQSIAIVRYQLALGLAGFERGSVSQLYTFAMAAVIITIASIVISARLYSKRRSVSVLILSLAAVALLFNLIVSAAILNLQ